MAGTHSAKDKDLAGAAVEDGALTPPTGDDLAVIDDLSGLATMY